MFISLLLTVYIERLKTILIHSSGNLSKVLGLCLFVLIGGCGIFSKPKKQVKKEPSILEKTVEIVKKSDSGNTDRVLEFYEVHNKAEFKGGEAGLMQFIRENLVYPDAAISKMS